MSGLKSDSLEDRELTMKDYRISRKELSTIKGALQELGGIMNPYGEEALEIIENIMYGEYDE